MDTATTVTIERLTDPAELFAQYGSEPQQRCYVSLDLRTGVLTALADPECGGAVSEDVERGRAFRLSIPCLVADEANRLLDEVKPLAARVLAGASIEWDGHNHVGVLDPSAADAYDEMVEEVAAWCADPEVPTVTAVDARYLNAEDAEELGIEAETTDAELDGEIARRAEAAIRAGSEGVIVIQRLDDALTAIRDELRQAVRDRLDAVCEQRAELLRERDELIRRLAALGDSDRSIAALAGCSHTKVQHIRG